MTGTTVYINLRRSRDGTLFGCSAVRLFVRSGQLLHCAHRRIVN